jgi:hypothetical protein
MTQCISYHLLFKKMPGDIDPLSSKMLTSLGMVCKLAESVTSFVLPFWIVLQRHNFHFNLLLWKFIHTASGVLRRHHGIDDFNFIYHVEGKIKNIRGGVKQHMGQVGFMHTKHTEKEDYDLWS